MSANRIVGFAGAQGVQGSQGPQGEQGPPGTITNLSTIADGQSITAQNGTLSAINTLPVTITPTQNMQDIPATMTKTAIEYITALFGNDMQMNAMRDSLSMAIQSLAAIIQSQAMTIQWLVAQFNDLYEEVHNATPPTEPTFLSWILFNNFPGHNAADYSAGLSISSTNPAVSMGADFQLINGYYYGTNALIGQDSNSLVITWSSISGFGGSTAENDFVFTLTDSSLPSLNISLPAGKQTWLTVYWAISEAAAAMFDSFGVQIGVRLSDGSFVWGEANGVEHVHEVTPQQLGIIGSQNNQPNGEIISSQIPIGTTASAAAITDIAIKVKGTPSSSAAYYSRLAIGMTYIEIRQEQ